MRPHQDRCWMFSDRIVVQIAESCSTYILTLYMWSVVKGGSRPEEHARSHRASMICAMWSWKTCVREGLS